MEAVELYLLITDFDLASQPEWRSYAGFDGLEVRADRHWEPLLKTTFRVEQVKHRAQLKYGDRAVPSGPTRGAYVSGRLDDSPPREDFHFVGYDAGMYFNSYGHYSLLLHHVSRHPAEWQLNAHKLFDRAEDATALVDWWLAWTPDHPGEKETVQWDDEYRPFAVFAAPPLPEVVV